MNNKLSASSSSTEIRGSSPVSKFTLISDPQLHVLNTSCCVSLIPSFYCCMKKNNPAESFASFSKFFYHWNTVRKVSHLALREAREKTLLLLFSCRFLKKLFPYPSVPVQWITHYNISSPSLCILLEYFSCMHQHASLTPVCPSLRWISSVNTCLISW